jgi:hypothetical protein
MCSFFPWDRNVRERVCWKCVYLCAGAHVHLFAKSPARTLPLVSPCIPDRPEFILGKEIAQTHTRPRFVVVIGFVSFKFSNFRQKYCQVVFSHANVRS